VDDAHAPRGARFTGGSFESENIVDYYMDPVEVGYGQFIDFSKDFIGKGGPRTEGQKSPTKKVTACLEREGCPEVMHHSLYTNVLPASS